MSSNYTGIIPESNVKLPKDSYKLQVMESKMSTSKNGSPMCVVTLEIQDSATFLQDGVEVNPNGLQIQHYMVLGDKNLGYGNSFNAFLKSMDLQPVQNAAQAQAYDIGVFNGKVLSAICETEEQEMKKPGTQEVMTNKVTGKPVLTQNKRVQRFLEI